MKRFLAALGCVLAGLAIPLFLFRCDFIKPNNSSAEDRFDDSVHGKTKQLIIPEPADPQHFSFLWMTDMHIKEDEGDYLNEIGNFASNKNASFILHSGDLADNGEESEYDYFLQREAEALPAPFYSAIGNHDLYGDGWDAFKDKIGPSVFSFDFGNSFFVVTDSANCEIGGKQMDWIEGRLSETHAKNIFVLSHFCLYDGEIETPAILCDPDERLKFLSLLKKYDVDYFLCGHKHYVQKDTFEGTTHIMGGTCSTVRKPYNSEPLFYYFQVNGGDVDFDKIYP